MSKEITLESIHDLLSGFIVKQEKHNTQTDANFAKADANFAKADANFAKADANFAKADANFASIDTKFDSLRDDLAEFRREEKANHNLSHRMIMQAFEAISDIRSELDADNTKPWLKK